MPGLIKKKKKCPNRNSGGQGLWLACKTNSRTKMSDKGVGGGEG